MSYDISLLAHLVARHIQTNLCSCPRVLKHLWDVAAIAFLSRTFSCSKSCFDCSRSCVWLLKIVFLTAQDHVYDCSRSCVWLLKIGLWVLQIIFFNVLNIMFLNGWSSGGMMLTGNSKSSERNLSNFDTKPTWTGLGLNAGHLGGSPLTGCLSHGTFRRIVGLLWIR
jgi:hypothetical protein